MNTPAPTTEPRKLAFASEDEIVLEVERLRTGGYTKRGNWTLPMACRHLTAGIIGVLKPPASTTPTPQQAAMKKGLVDVILATGKPPPGLEAPEPMVPPADCRDDEIDRLKDALGRLKAYKHSHVEFGPMGPVSIDEMRKLTLLHAAHHLRFLEPASKPARRAGLSYANEDAVIADLETLRMGYAQAGMWSLAQVCWHLDQATQARMRPAPPGGFEPNTPEQDARRPVLQQALSTGRLPDGIKAPDPLEPPPAVGEDAVDAFVASLRRYKAFPGPTSPHRLFGHLTEPDARRLNLIHCAHHLSYLTPLPVARAAGH